MSCCLSSLIALHFLSFLSLSQWQSSRAGNSQQTSEDGSPAASDSQENATVTGSEVNILLLILHGGNVLDGMQDIAAKNSDINTFKAAFDAVIPAHFPSAMGRIAFRLVPCPSTCCEVMSLLSKWVRYYVLHNSSKNISSHQGVLSSNNFVD